MTEMINIVIKSASKTRLRWLKKEYELKLLNSEKGSDEAFYCCDVLDAIDEELERRN